MGDSAQISVSVYVIDDEFRSLIPPLSGDEKQQLRANIKAEGVREPLVCWGDVIVDGHHRYEICTDEGMAFNVVQIDLQSVRDRLADAGGDAKKMSDRDVVKVWMIDTQRGRRNLPPFVRCELEATREHLIPGRKRGRPKTNRQNSDDLRLGKDGRKKEAAKRADVSHDTYAKAKAIKKAADAGTIEPGVIDKLRRNEESINAVHTKHVVQKKKKDQQRKKIETLKAKEIEPPMGRYDVIVIDPPWPMEKIEREVRPNQVAFDYPTMQEDELARLQMPSSDDCHLWLWTTHRFLPMAFRLLDAWSFRYVCTFVWHKPGGFQPIGLPQYNCEFALYARHGSPVFSDTKAFNTCFEAPRSKHSEKPEQFYDIVRRVTAGHRIDMFNRRHINGFIGWGQEAVDERDAR